MITVRERAGRKEITASVTEFTGGLEYCQYMIDFMVKGKRKKPSAAAMQGAAIHKGIEKYEQKHVVLEPVSEQQLSNEEHNIEFAREKIMTRLLRPVSVGGTEAAVLLMGRADKIMRENSTLIVQDEKTARNAQKYDSLVEPYRGQKLQVLTYLNSMFTEKGSMNPDDWFEVPHERKMWRVNVLDREDGLRLYKSFEGYQTDADLEYLNGSLETFVEIVLGKRLPDHHNSANKCRACGYFDDCSDRIE
ncbi:hypothetical protein CENSYa_0041 [Cenarchaeum symbiosum A]|uniref:PD-(D/E)XK endonuclease-like domain-containing protein n=1 Tax=Cenarchaeum symbiosum (strain A) TaxID=414004 RepID=A0RZA7_CENSY|nr:hypothetical protein CENSYa_0041 [Cenarchaeum symbiosum A]